MKSIGIIPNPNSGKDIRRLVSHATVFDNNEKVNIVERVILAAQEYGVEVVYVMPDSYLMGRRIKEKLESTNELTAKIILSDIKIDSSSLDSTNAAKDMREKGVGCIVALGGDGTSRAIAKEIQDVPLIPLSTGTNNVFPQMIEGTTAGIAAAIIANRDIIDVEDSLHKVKRIDIYKNGEFIDIALIDAVVTRNTLSGAKAVWDMEQIDKIIVTRAHPSSIGFSSIVGCCVISNDNDEFGVLLNLHEKKQVIKAPVAPGVIEELSVGNVDKISIGDSYKFVCEYQGTLALDGEREVKFNEGDHLEFKMTRNGPVKVDVKLASELAHKQGFFYSKI